MVDWSDAQCVGLWEWFFPQQGEPLYGDKNRKWVAEFLCSGCALRKACAILGAEIEDKAENSRYSSWGIWGGMDRRELLRE